MASKYAVDPSSDSKIKRNKLGRTPLHTAVFEGDDERVKDLLRSRVAVNSDDKSGQTPLHMAVRESDGQIRIMQMLLEARASTDVKDIAGQTPLHVAAQSKSAAQVLQTLLEARASTDVKDISGQTALHIAAQSEGETKILQMLLEARASPDVKDTRGLTPLELADALKCVEAVKVLQTASFKSEEHPDKPIGIKADGDLKEEASFTSRTPVEENAGPSVVPVADRPADPTGEAENVMPKNADKSAKSDLSHEARALHIRLRERPAIVENTSDISYYGSIRTGAQKCWASFPGKYPTGWDALVQQLGGDSVGCVFLCTPQDGLGRHRPDPEAPDGSCYCHRIYGTRDYKALGYLNVVKSPTPEKIEHAKDKASHTNAVVISEDATEDEMEQAKQRARKAWKKSGKTASWGCAWYEVWLQKVTEAVAQGQKLQVVFFAGEKGQGKVKMEELPNVNLWNGEGLGGSQKAEVATFDRMMERHGAAWKYEEVDVADFLEAHFQIGTTVDAWYNSEWCRGTLVKVPDSFQEDPAPTLWEVRSKTTGKVFKSQHLRHVTDAVQKLLQSIGKSVDAGKFAKDLLDKHGKDSIGKTASATEKLLEAIGHDALKDMVKDALADGIDVGTTSEQMKCRDGIPSVAVTIKMRNIEALQKLRDQILSGDLEIQINHALTALGCNSKIEVDQSLFCHLLERTLLEFKDLTKHQKDVLHRFQEPYVNLSAPAGAGKTFVAIQHVMDALRLNATGQVLYVSPSPPLGLFFLQWIATRCASEKDPELPWDKVFSRIRLLHWPYTDLLVPTIEGNQIFTKPRGTAKDLSEPFVLAVLDEAHHIFRPGLASAFWNITDLAKRILFLSDDSQSFLDHTFPGIQMQHEKLQEVLRCTQRIVSGAAAFHSSAASREDLRSGGTVGPPLKSFIFETSDAASRKTGYVEQTLKAIHHIIRSYRSLSLHRRLALLVPDETFLGEFHEPLLNALEANFPERKFELTTSSEAMTFLPMHLCQDIDVEKEVLILDTVSNVVGLEQLFVVSIGLDSKIESTGRDAVTRARLYQGLTRAQFLAIVVNEYLPGGWLEFLRLLKFKQEEFKDSDALAETKADAAERLMRKIDGAHRPDEARSTASRIEPKLSEVAGSADDPPAAAKDPSSFVKKPIVRDTSVWDTDENKIDAEIREPDFNPLKEPPSSPLHPTLEDKGGKEQKGDGDSEKSDPKEDPAKAHFIRRLKKNPTDAEAWFHLGELGGGAVGGVAFDRKRCFERCLEANARIGSAWHHLGALRGGTVHGVFYDADACDRKLRELRRGIS